MEDFHGVKFNFMVTEIVHGMKYFHRDYKLLLWHEIFMVAVTFSRCVHGMKEYFTRIPKIFLTFRAWTVKIGIA